MAKETPVAFAGMGLAILLLIAGFKGKTVAQVLAGDTGDSADPAGGQLKFDTIVADATSSVPGDAGKIASSLAHPGQGTVNIGGVQVAAWIAPVVSYAHSHGWRGNVLSGYRSDTAQRAACIHVCGNPNGCPNRCAKPGTSNHRETKYPGGAIDVSDPAGFQRAIASYPGGAPLRNGLPGTDPGHMSVSGT